MLRVYIKTPGGGAWVEYTPVLRPDRNFEIGGMALNGQADQGTITVDDPDYTLEEQTDTAGHREVKITEDDSGSEVVLALGRIGPKSMERGAHPQGRELTLTVEDVNAELRGIVVDKWDRPSETGRARVVELVAAYLDGPSSTELIPGTGPFAGDQWGRNSTTLDITGTHVPSINNVLMPAKRYDATDPLSVLRECAEWEGKNVHVFVADDGSKKLVYLPTNDTATNECDFEISDNPSQVDDDTIFAPWWIVGPALNIDPLETVTGINLIHPDGARSFERSPTDEANFDRWEESMYSEADSGFSTELDALLLARSRETRRRQFAIRLPGSKVHQIKPGMLLHVIRARAADIPNVNTTTSKYRIAQIRYQWHGPDAEDDNAYLVLVTLEATIKTARRWGTRPPIRPPSPGGGTAPTVGTLVINDGQNGDTFNTSGVVTGSGADRALYVFILSQNTITSCNWYPEGYPPGVTEPLTKIRQSDSLTGGGFPQRLSLWRLLDPSTEDTGAVVRINQGTGSTASAIFIPMAGVNQTDPNDSVVDSTGTGSGSTISIPFDTFQVAINAAGWQLGNANPASDPTPGGGQTATVEGFNNNAPGQADSQTGGGYGSAAPTWGWGTSRTWTAMGVAVNGIGGAGDSTEPVGNTGGGTTGTGGTYSPLNHVHEHGMLSEDEAHQHDLLDLQNDASANGLDDNAQIAFDQLAPIGSASDPTVDDYNHAIGAVWVNTTSDDKFILVDDTAGAAVWDLVSSGSGAPDTADYLVGTTQAGLSAEIVVGTTPGGELGNTWASPTVDATHAGTNHLQPVRRNSAGSVFTRRQLNFIEGSNVTLTVADDAGNDEVDITVAASSSGGGLLLQAYLGYNTIGGSWQAMTADRHYMKKITLANDCLIASVDCHIRVTTDAARDIAAFVLSDNAGTAEALLAANGIGSNNITMQSASGGRWFSIAMGIWLTAGDYWFGVVNPGVGTLLEIAYDTTGGADHYYTTATGLVRDATGLTITDDTANRRSIRVNTIR